MILNDEPEIYSFYEIKGKGANVPPDASLPVPCDRRRPTTSKTPDGNGALSGLTEEKMEEFFHFWRDDFKFEHRELGCAIQCMSRHFNLLTDGERMHHENTDKFIKSFPNGEVLSQKMVTLIHSCEQKFDDMDDHCWRILRIAECFKSSCQELGIAPTMEMMMAEFIMESET